MSKPRAAWDSIFFDSDGALVPTITSSAADDGYPVENITTLLNYDVWKASTDSLYMIEIEFSDAQDIDTFAVSNHNLNSQGARIKLEGYDPTGSSAPLMTSIVPWFYPSNDKTFAKMFATANHKGFRISIDGGDGDSSGSADIAPYLGTVFLGEYMEFDQHAKLPVSPHRSREYGNKAVGGTGYNRGYASEYSILQSRWAFENLDPDWVEDEWEVFYDAHRNKPFFWIWNYSKAPNEVYFVTFGRPINDQRHDNPLHDRLSFIVESRKEY